MGLGLVAVGYSIMWWGHPATGPGLVIGLVLILVETGMWIEEGFERGYHSGGPDPSEEEGQNGK